MKLIRVGPPGEELPAMIAPDGDLRGLSDHIKDLNGETISPAGLSLIAGLDWKKLPKLDKAQRIGPCVSRPVNFACIGLNYADHAAETNSPIPAEPILFLKSLSAYSGPNDDIVMPRGMHKLDWEVELGVVIGSKARYVSEAEALDKVAGYCVVNDVSEREYQLERGSQWDKGKGCDTFGPTGPWLVTKDEVSDPQVLAMWADLDGVRMQSGNTRTMIFSVAKIVSFLSEIFTLHPGDIIATGTPPGVGIGKKPKPIFAEPGQTITIGIEKLGIQTQKVVASPYAKVG
jgi:2-keto-4-pentenoate hydratase/2-oxohepta-3-ene-1,7-dioic acid hydratase in catechol pathway